MTVRVSVDLGEKEDEAAGPKKGTDEDDNIERSQRSCASVSGSKPLARPGFVLRFRNRSGGGGNLPDDELLCRRKRTHAVTQKPGDRGPGISLTARPAATSNVLVTIAPGRPARFPSTPEDAAASPFGRTAASIASRQLLI